MRLKVIACVAAWAFVMAACLVSAVGPATSLSEGQSVDKSLLENLYYPKGSFGLVGAKVYVSVKSPRNELVVRSGSRWTGEPRGVRQVVLLWKGEPVSEATLPPDFELSKAILVSFEGERITFVDFETGTSGYYRRLALPDP
jgi:hypothetical protein